MPPHGKSAVNILKKGLLQHFGGHRFELYGKTRGVFMKLKMCGYHSAGILTIFTPKLFVVWYQYFGEKKIKVIFKRKWKNNGWVALLFAHFIKILAIKKQNFSWLNKLFCP